MTNYEKPTIRRIEDGNWYWVDKNVIRYFTPKVGALGIAVYSYLASLVDTNQSCYPSQQNIADVLGYSRSSVSRAIVRLEKTGLISVDKHSSRYPQQYHLLQIDVSLAQR